METKKLYEERERYRNHIHKLWKKGGTFSCEDHEIFAQLNVVHKKILEIEMNDAEKPKKREVYSVCGWSVKHGYFRNKEFKSENLEEAKERLETLKKDKDWGIPTVIVKETHFRKSTPAMGEFDKEIDLLGFSDSQEIIEKHMMGSKEFRWANLINDNDDRYTY